MSSDHSDPRRDIDESSPQRSSEASRAPESDSAARAFYERLEQLGQLVDVDANTDLATLPPHVTHVRYPNGVVERVGFA
jgi:hypothetical protein